MPSKQWRETIALYQKTATEPQASPVATGEQILEASKTLFDWLNSNDGQNGLELLRVSGAHLVLFRSQEEPLMPGLHQLYVLNGFGLRGGILPQVEYPAHLEISYDYDEDRFINVDPNDVVTTMVNDGHVAPDDVVPAVERALDELTVLSRSPSYRHRSPKIIYIKS